MLLLGYGNGSRENGPFGKLANHLLEVRLSNDIGFQWLKGFSCQPKSLIY